jgi:hypothetical protein
MEKAEWTVLIVARNTVHNTGHNIAHNTACKTAPTIAPKHVVQLLFYDGRRT